MMPSTLPEHNLIRHLRAFGFAAEDFVIFGSGPLLAHGLRDDVHDLDVLVSQRLWPWVLEHGEPITGEITGDQARAFYGGRIEFYERWISAEWNTSDLIARADVIGGIRFAPLPDVLKYKKLLNRPKDRADIELLTDYLARSVQEWQRPAQDL